MKLTLTIAALIFTSNLFCQTHQNKATVYGSFYGLLDVKAAKPGAGVYFGVSPIRPAGLGIGFQMIQLSGLTPKTTKMGVDLFAEFRLFARMKNITPSFAFQYGTLNYHEATTPSSAGYVSVKGKQTVGANINICLTNKPSGKGLSFGYSIKSISFEVNSKIGNDISSTTSSGNYHLITLGYNF